MAAVAAAEVMAEPEPESDPFAETEEQIEEEDPFAFDFEVDAPEEESFEGFDETVASADLEPSLPEEDAFDEFEVPELDDVATDSAFDDALGAEMDELADEDSSDDPFSEFEVEDTNLEDFDAAVEEQVAEQDPASLAEDDIFNTEEGFDLEDTLSGLNSEEELNSDDFEVQEESEDFSEEESFVNNLLTEDEQDDVDESSVFDVEPDTALADSIDEVLAEAQEEDEFGGLDVPEFGADEAAADMENSSDDDDDEEPIDFFDASGDEVATKLDLARAYMDMGDEEGARVILEDVINAGNESQVAEASSMMERMFPSE